MVPEMPRSAAVVPLWVSAKEIVCVVSPLTTSDPPERPTVALDPAETSAALRMLTTSPAVAAVVRSTEVVVAPTVRATGPAETPLERAPRRSLRRVELVRAGVRVRYPTTCEET